MFEMVNVPCQNCGAKRTYLAGETIKKGKSEVLGYYYLYNCPICDNQFEIRRSDIDYFLPESRAIIHDNRYDE